MSSFCRFASTSAREEFSCGRMTYMDTLKKVFFPAILNFPNVLLKSKKKCSHLSPLYGSLITLASPTSLGRRPT